ncbi:MAG: hypothetical protein JW860_15780 [Sedimentisphaerales bacterium]|nr:hypothetical protein [Sedimentisphaerales bacterium]
MQSVRMKVIDGFKIHKLRGNSFLFACRVVLNVLIISLLLICPAGALIGDGTVESPFRISSAADLEAVGNDPNNWNGHFELTADIDMSGYIYKTAIIASDPNGMSDDPNVISNDPNFFQGTPFTGIFNGNNHIISNFTIDTEAEDNDYLGLFGFTDSNSIIFNLGLENVTIIAAGDSDNVGCLAGYSAGYIGNCYAAGSLTTIDDPDELFSPAGIASGMGGLTGHNVGLIVNCYSTAEVTGPDPLGGLSGTNEGCIVHCYCVGQVTGSETDYVGGLVGYSYAGSILRCYFLRDAGPDNGLGTAAKKNALQHKAGFEKWDFINEIGHGTNRIWMMPGDDRYPVLSSFNTFEELPTLEGEGTEAHPYLIYTRSDFGAIYHYDHSASYRLRKSIDLSQFQWTTAPVPYFTGHFDGNGYKINNLNITGSAWLGLFGYVDHALIDNVTLQDETITGQDGSWYLGSLAAVNSGGTIRHCTVSSDIISGDSSSDIGSLVGFNEKGDITNNLTSGTVTVGSNSYYIGNIVGTNYRGTITDCFVQADIAAGDETDNIGNIAGLNSEGTISGCQTIGSINCGLDSFNIGNLVGLNETGEINNSYADGSLTCGDLAGSLGTLVGTNDDGTIEQCYAAGNVTSGDESLVVGGFVGFNLGSISDCYATGKVSSGPFGENLGGLAGSNNGTIQYCYSAGSIAAGPDSENLGGFVGYEFEHDLNAYIGCFWNADTYPSLTGLGNTDDPNNVVSSTTSQMQLQDTFSEYEWDFDAVWVINEDLEYPVLQWQSPKLEFEIDSLTMEAGQGRNSISDSFTLIGTLSSKSLRDILHPANDLEIISISVISEGDPNSYGYSEDLNLANVIVDFRRHKVTYQRKVEKEQPGYISFFKINLVKGEFTVTGGNLDLTGMQSPVEVTLRVGSYLGSQTAYDGTDPNSGGIDVINGKNPMPIRFMMGFADALQVTKGKFTLGRKKPYTDSLTIEGLIAVEYEQFSFADNNMEVTWGARIIELEEEYFYQQSDKNVSRFKKPKDENGTSISAEFDLEKCAFKITIKNDEIGDQGTEVDFTIKSGPFNMQIPLILTPKKPDLYVYP